MLGKMKANRQQRKAVKATSKAINWEVHKGPNNLYSNPANTHIYVAKKGTTQNWQQAKKVGKTYKSRSVPGFGQTLPLSAKNPHAKKAFNPYKPHQVKTHNPAHGHAFHVARAHSGA